MKQFSLVFIAALTMAVACTDSQAGDIAAGKSKSAACVACHGANGISLVPLYPNLAGQKEMYLAKQLKAFRDGQRNDPSMKPFVAALSDQDIANLAAYYASLDPSGK